ncbi:MAG: VOC family protein [Pseudomonadota bacterium]
MAIRAFDHLVILVNDLDDGIARWRDQFGLSLSHHVELEDVGIRQAFFSLDDGSFLELVAPAHDQSPVAGLIESNGEGVHVLALRVDDLEESAQALQQARVELKGLGTPNVFIVPCSANGVMVQLWPKDRPHRWRDGSEK